MGTVPTPYTWMDEEIPDFRQMNARLRDVQNFLMNPPMVKLRKTLVQAIPNNTTTPVTWDTVEVETENMWDSTASTKIKPSTPGWYVGNTGYSFDFNTTGYREMNVYKNGVTTTSVIRQKNLTYSAGTESIVARGNMFLEQFNGTTDYIELHVFQTSGGSLNMLATDPRYQSDIALTWIGAL